MDQDEYINQLRPITHPELTGAAADAKAPKLPNSSPTCSLACEELSPMPFLLKSGLWCMWSLSRGSKSPPTYKPDD
eukprot:5646189-Pyramimonas_sp.AAC.1